MLEMTQTALLKVLRAIAELNQHELAQRAGIHHTTISAYETGKTPTRTTVTKVLEAFQLKAADLQEVEDFVLYMRQKMGIASTGVSSTGGPPRPEAWRREAQKLAADWSRFGRRFAHVLDLWASSGKEGSRPEERR